MSRFKKNGKKEVPELNTGSMSDIIFMFLFFFMVITTMRESEAKVKFTEPTATEYQKLDKKNSYTVYMGEPTVQGAALLDNAVSIQFNDKLAASTTDEGLKTAVDEFVQSSRDASALKNEDPDKITYYLKIDNNTRMTAVNQLKLALRKKNALKIQYATKKEVKRGK
ncbi:MAG: biopolymer transporter ExbD [Bacteroidales bacterium]|jgi:biopolymer transport protein ExbD|nr:biopolymer transporter ExbD [Bacteroidales bacterium]